MPGATGKPIAVTGQPPSGSEFLTETELREYEKENLRRALEACGWRISGPGGAAKRLGVKASTLAYRMSVFGIEKPR
jgi:transcriptional regulator with GAF, ATPase, and Fis domain